MSWRHQMPKHETYFIEYFIYTKHILLNNLGNKHSLVMKFG